MAYNWVLPRTPLKGNRHARALEGLLADAVWVAGVCWLPIKGHGTCTTVVGGPGTFGQQANGALEVLTSIPATVSKCTGHAA